MRKDWIRYFRQNRFLMKIQKIEDWIGDYEDWSPYKKERYVSDRAGKN